MLLQVGLKSLSYEMQEEKPAYDSISLLGETNVFAYFYLTNLKNWNQPSCTMWSESSAVHIYHFLVRYFSSA